ncbi:MAG TPA: hypothetical protein DCS82_02070 [Rhodospirillaceae bacterium]|nr:hypothetical protein [Rhodospirillaceae bacterium]HAA93395.1 hypothetical protein [Rhodospirillaceae bacterium]HAT34478.1 hypothetical protein [Rhodospirillaceae bacterium]|tara:strand:- start:555 stop:1301 length:747 start_codon:yes stop_codon:yes gene_type:complete
MAHYDTQKSFKAWQKILPNQEFNANLYRRDDVAIEQSIYTTILDTCNLRPPQKEFDIEATDMFTIEEMASSRITLSFLDWLIRVSRASTVLEIGTFVGVSALYFARALPQNGKVVTLEKFDHFAEIASRNFASNDLDHKIELICADAFDAIDGLVAQASFDIVFIDGNKERYEDYLVSVLDCVSSSGIIVIDDALFHGDVFNESIETEKGRGVRSAIDRAKSLDGWHKTFLPISNGMMLLQKAQTSLE